MIMRSLCASRVHVGAVAGIAIGMFVCGAVLSFVITAVICSRWYVLLLCMICIITQHASSTFQYYCFFTLYTHTNCYTQ